MIRCCFWQCIITWVLHFGRQQARLDRSSVRVDSVRILKEQECGRVNLAQRAANSYYRFLATLLATVAALFNVSYRLSTEPNNGVFMIGLDVGTSCWFLFRLMTKFVLAMGIGLLVVKRAQQQLQIEAPQESLGNN